MRKPRPPFASKGADPLEPRLDVGRERRRAAAEVVEHEHRDAPGLPVTGRGETQIRLGRRRGRPQLAHDGRELDRGPVSEEGDGDVQVAAWDGAHFVQGLLLPRLDGIEHRLRQAQGDEEAQALIAPNASRAGHAASSRLRDSRRRTRWSAPTAARDRIATRSPGKLDSRPTPPSGPSAWRYTSPTGFSAVPPPGPAMPVTATATSAPSRSRAPRAIASATSADTAPCAARSSSGTPSAACFTSFAYATMPPAKTSLAPGIEVRRCATIPPVSDSADARRSPRARKSARTCP